MDYIELIEKIRVCSFKVREDFAPGYLESVYANALMIHLREAGIYAEKEKPIPLIYHGEMIGNFRADIVVENCLILELKAVTEILPIHEMQLVNYLNVTKFNVGILINYGSPNYYFMPKFRTLDLLYHYRHNRNKINKS